MRFLGASLGLALVCVYAVLGAFTINDWAVVAASGVPLERARAAMTAEGQPYSAAPGVAFAVAGVLLGAAWAAVTGAVRAIPGWGCSAGWCALLMLGSPAFFAAGFSNMMSVGDTFVDWRPDSARAIERLFHLSSAIAGILLLGILAATAGRALLRARRRAPGAPS
ncbi:hypothetical protein JD276_02910 [Leucobacter sp. CSA1]|uniref:Uncharacterized protein n=1 Tax=Leucobacter chromiisoli TaxID=2796471 RepID=A0A934Q5Y1_9MICO|nr:hypothetical protein [Leucobacter chromiisoli]MBK0417985.1 hypothetical protein [Leucobacter chromiisoli]